MKKEEEQFDFEPTEEELAIAKATNYQVNLTCAEFATLIRFFNNGETVRTFKKDVAKKWIPELRDEILSEFESASEKFVHNAIEIKPSD